MTSFAAVVLAHTDPAQLRRLVLALEDVPIFLHCDARTPAILHRQLISRLPPRVTLCERRPTKLASWSLMDAELRALKVALARTSAEHIGILSGADYPLLSMAELDRELARWDGSSWMWNEPLPYRLWDTPRCPDGGLWRVQFRFLTWRDQAIYVRDLPLRWPVRRTVPSELDLRTGLQWKIYARRHAEMLFHLMDKRPDLVRFWRTTLIPEESFASSMLGSSALLGSDALPVCYDHPWYMDWPRGLHHPSWVRGANFEDIARQQKADPMDPAAAFTPTSGSRRDFRRLFARKFSTTIDTVILDRIDAELRI